MRMRMNSVPLDRTLTQQEDRWSICNALKKLFLHQKVKSKGTTVFPRRNVNPVIFNFSVICGTTGLKFIFHVLRFQCFDTTNEIRFLDATVASFIPTTKNILQVFHFQFLQVYSLEIDNFLCWQQNNDRIMRVLE